MSDYRGAFAWYELMTSDAAAAKAFYAAVIGWDMRPVAGDPNSYTVLQVGDVGVGGLMGTPEDAATRGVPPHWIGYVGVEDVDAFQEKVRAKGGSVMRPAADIPGVGRFAAVADPQGAPFVLFKPSGEGERLPAFPPASGYFAWRELAAADGETAFAFYADLFGWTIVHTVDMGAFGIYRLFADRKGGEAVGGMMTKGPDMPHPWWTYFIEVEGVGAAVARTTAAGGSVVAAPHQTPAGNWIARLKDPQGALFAITSNTA